MTSPRDLPQWLRATVNVIGILGVGATLLGWVQPILGVLILIAAPLYVAWEAWPWAARNTRRYAVVSLTIFIMIGAGVGAGMWWIVRSAPSPETNHHQNQTNQATRPAPTSGTQTLTTRKMTVGSPTTPQEDPIEGLSALGWTIKRDGDTLTFEIISKPLPNMAKSREYFSELKEPFRLHLQLVPSIQGLEDLGGIQELKELVLSGSDLTSISQLAELTSLQKLELTQILLNGHNEIDSAPLSRLTHLRSLDLSSSRISSLDPVTHMPRLEKLLIGSTLVRDLSPIHSLRALRSLDVRDSAVVDLSPASELGTLDELTIGANQVQSLGALASLRNLHKLTVIGQNPVDLAPIGDLTHLTSLFVWGPASMDLGFLAKLSSLKDLQISGFGAPVGPRSTVIGSAFICASGALKTLTLGALEISAIDFAPHCKSLTQLNLRDIPLHSLSEITDIRTLKTLSLVDVPVVEITPLLALPDLERLTLIRVPARADVLSALERKGVKIESP